MKAIIQLIILLLTFSIFYFNLNLELYIFPYILVILLSLAERVKEKLNKKQEAKPLNQTSNEDKTKSNSDTVSENITPAEEVQNNKVDSDNDNSSLYNRDEILNPTPKKESSSEREAKKETNLKTKKSGYFDIYIKNESCIYKQMELKELSHTENLGFNFENKTAMLFKSKNYKVVTARRYKETENIDYYGKIDLIAFRGTTIELIQCKKWVKHKIKDIDELYETIDVMKAYYEKNKNKITRSIKVNDIKVNKVILRLVYEKEAKGIIETDNKDIGYVLTNYLKAKYNKKGSDTLAYHNTIEDLSSYLNYSK